MPSRAAAPAAHPGNAAESVPADRGGWVPALVIVVAGLAVQLAIAPFGNFRFDTSTMAGWADRLTGLPLDHFYATKRLADHLPGDLWVLWGIAEINRLVGSGNTRGATFVFLLKLVPIAADAGIAVMLFLIGRRLRGRRAGLRAAALFAFNPAPIFIATVWGQWDAVSAFVVVTALWFQIDGVPELSLPVLAYATLIKPQFVVLGPLFLIAALDDRPHDAELRADRRPADVRNSLRRVAVGLVAAGMVAFAACRPFDVGLPLLPARWSLIGRVRYAVDLYQKTTIAALNLWALVGPGNVGTRHVPLDVRAHLLGLSDHAWGEALTALVYFVVLAVFARRRDAITLVWAVLTTSFALYVLPTRVHERYLFPAIVLGALAAGLAPRLRAPYVVLSAVYLANVAWVYNRSYGILLLNWWQPGRYFVLVGAGIVCVLFVATLIGALPVMTEPPTEPLVDIPSRLGRVGVRWDGLVATGNAGLGRIRDGAKPIGVVLVVSVAAFLECFRLSREGFGNVYYAAAVKSMMANWHNFVFAAFDPGGYLAIDKPPVDLWLQVASAELLGFRGVSLMLPQAIAGIVSVALLYRLVADPWGDWAGLAAALVLALTPISVVTSRNNTMDGVLVLILLVAAWMVSRATETGRLGPLLVAAGLVGLGFNVKMAEALLVVPAFVLLYLVAAPRSLGARLGHLSLAAAMLLAVSFAWVIAVDQVPAAQRPYVASTVNNTEWELAIGHNGLDRLLPGRSIAIVGRQGGVPTAGIGGRGPLRLLNAQVGGQIGWLLPLAVLGPFALLATRSRRLQVGRWGVRLDRRGQALLLWGGWTLTQVVFFSVANYFHRYYTVTLAPGLAALAGIGVVTSWQAFHRRDRWWGWLPGVLLVTAVAQIHILSTAPVWRWRLAPGLVGLVGLAGVALWALRRNPEEGRRFAGIATAGALVGLLVAPAIWSALPVLHGQADESFPVAGPGIAATPPRVDPRLLAYLETNRHGESYLVATTRATDAAPIILASGQPVMSLGGYSGYDQTTSLKQIATLVAEGKLRFFLFPSSTNRSFAASVNSWLTKRCVLVPADLWQTAKQRASASHRLFDCGELASGHGKPVPTNDKPNGSAGGQAAGAG
jgi:4-amino-4-deoxy-L-arabinose transferase-like glycosyltransferase